MKENQSLQQGFTISEVLTASAVIAIVLAAMGWFMVNLVRIPPRLSEQGSNVSEAEVEMERMSDTIRNANNRYPVGTDTVNRWLIQAHSDRIRVRADVDDDIGLERVEYRQQGDELWRYVDGVGAVLTRYLRNDSDTPMFTYFSLGGGEALQLAADLGEDDLDSVDRILIRLVIDVDLEQDPDAVVVETVVTPRKTAH